MRKSAPLPGNYSVGDLINFQIKVVDRDDSRAESEAYRWSSTARIVGFENDKTLWVLCEGTPFCVAIDRIRPSTPAETLAYLYLNKSSEDPIYTAGPD